VAANVENIFNTKGIFAPCFRTTDENQVIAVRFNDYVLIRDIKKLKMGIPVIYSCFIMDGVVIRFSGCSLAKSPEKIPSRSIFLLQENHAAGLRNHDHHLYLAV